MEYEVERLAAIPCANYRCKWGFDEGYEQNCRLTFNHEPAATVCGEYSPLRDEDANKRLHEVFAGLDGVKPE